ncbi:MAG: hypothetical protein ACP5I7_03895 [Sulfolobales archaeon]|jgi:molybdopterin converting factor small subunit
MSREIKLEIRLYGSLRDLFGWDKKILCISEKKNLREILEKNTPEILDKLLGSDDIILVLNSRVIPIRDIDKYIIDSDAELDILPSIVGGGS